MFYAPELPRPAGVVQEGPQVEPVVVGAVVLGVIRGGERGHLVSVRGILGEEPLHFVSHLVGEERAGVGGRGSCPRHTGLRGRTAPHNTGAPPKAGETKAGAWAAGALGELWQCGLLTLAPQDSASGDLRGGPRKSWFIRLPGGALGTPMSAGCSPNELAEKQSSDINADTAPQKEGAVSLLRRGGALCRG